MIFTTSDFVKIIMFYFSVPGQTMMYMDLWLMMMWPVQCNTM